MKSCYLVGDTLNGLVKIGNTQNIKKRLAVLRTSNLNLMLLFVLPYNLEKELHLLFKDKRVKGEWFRLSNEDIRGVVEIYNEYLKRELE